MSAEIVRVTPNVSRFTGLGSLLDQTRQKRQLIARDEHGRLVPVARDPKSFDLETSFLEQNTQHRWLLTTCIAGITGTLLVSGFVLGLFGHNARPDQALAAVEPPVPLIVPRIPVADKQVLAERDLEGGFAYPEVMDAELPYNKEKTKVLDAEIQSAASDSENITTITKTPPPEPVDENFYMPPGSNLALELELRGVSKAAADALVAAVDPVYATRKITAGTRIDVTFDRQIDFYGREVTFPVQLSFKASSTQTVTADADEDGQFTALIDGQPEEVPKVAEAPPKPEVPAKPIFTQFHSASKVGASLASTAQDNKIPNYIVSEFTRVFSYDVDFQRQVNAGDTFEVFYGNPLSGTSSKRKVLHMARLVTNGVSRTYYRFTSSDGQSAYYDESGRSASRALLKTPISGSKLTSGFGVRRHPVLGYTKMHTGVDFGGGYGTPIRAAGAGEIDQAGRESGYGNTIVIRHNSSYETLYAHMSRFAAGIRPGVRVNQGQIIGYVGATGRATGPHLHYEVHYNDRAINPLSVRASGGRQLAGKDLSNFRNQKQKVLALMQNAPSANQVAQNNQ